MRPVLRRSNPAIARNSVDLPQPEGPNSAVIPVPGKSRATESPNAG
jgi:hypothetical protein